MDREVEFHPDAHAEVFEARAWYAERSSLAADAFVHEVDLMMRRLIEGPERFPWHLSGTRRAVFPRFPYAVVYYVTDSLILVLAIAHQRRRPDYWQRRRDGLA